MPRPIEIRGRNSADRSEGKIKEREVTEDYQSKKGTEGQLLEMMDVFVRGGSNLRIGWQRNRK